MFNEDNGFILHAVPQPSLDAGSVLEVSLTSMGSTVGSGVLPTLCFAGQGCSTAKTQRLLEELLIDADAHTCCLEHIYRLL